MFENVFIPSDEICKKDEKDEKAIDFDELICGFPPERLAEMDEDLLWNV